MAQLSQPGPAAGRRPSKLKGRLQPATEQQHVADGAMEQTPFCHRAYLESGSGRSWNFTTLLVVPLPPSRWKGALVLYVAHMAFPFQPAFGSSTRASIHLV